MYTSVRKIVTEGLLGKWVKVTDDEIQCIVDSIPGENMLRNAPLNRMDGGSVGNNLRHYIDRGHIVVCNGNQEAEKHPLDLVKQNASVGAPSEGKVFTSAREKGVFESAV